MVLRPQITVNIKSNLSLIEARGPGVIAIMGSAQWGPLDSIQIASSLNDALSVYKDDSTTVTTLTMIKGLDLAYRNGAGTIKCLRVADGTESTSGIALLSGATTVINLYGAYDGSYGNNISVTITANGSNRDATITDGIVTEQYTNSGNGYSSNLELVDDINADSQLVTATSLTDTYLVSAITATNLAGGLDGSAGITSSNFTTAFDNYLTSEEFNILVIPGTTADSFQTTMVGKLNTRASTDEQFSIFVSGIAQDESIATATARTASGIRLSLLAPSIKYTNRISGVQGYLDGSYLACAYAGLIATGWPNISPTHKALNTEGVIVNTTTLKKYYNNGEQEQLLNSRFTPVSLVSGIEVPVRAVTRDASTTDVFYEQNIVDIVDYVRRQVVDRLNPFIGDPNLGRVRAVMAKNVDGILEQDKLDEIIVDYQSTLVSEGVSPDTVNVAITLKPTFAINFITVNLTIDNVS